MTKCKHAFCKSCILTHLTHNTNCPLCKGPCNVSSIFGHILSLSNQKFVEAYDPDRRQAGATNRDISKASSYQKRRRGKYYAG